ncbi:hypothetical protein M2311_000001, partial [Rhizobium leguminosarum]|nr:hypothetical protein [Rhizobium leguminosarum]
RAFVYLVTGRGFNASSGARQEGEADAAGQKLSNPDPATKSQIYEH